MHIPYLSGSDLDGLEISAADIVDAIERTILGSQAGWVWAAPKAVVVPPDDQRYMMAALAAQDNPSLLAVKTVVLNPENSAGGLPQINGLVTMLDSKTGLPAAILDGNWITAVRTAGLSATAAKYLARSDATTLGFVGCGVQARSHLALFSALYPIRRIVYHGRGQSNQSRLAAAAGALNLGARACQSPEEVLAEADIVVTTVTHTAGTPPFLSAQAMKPGGFAAVVDLAAPWHRDSFGVLDCVAIDDLVQEAALPNKLCAPEHVAGDLTGLVSATFVGRTSDAARTAFVFRGHALGDLALSVAAISRYRARQSDA
ncbi:MAG: ornithine cyclodeaminase family protein [Pseudomonadota bacterium]